ncbi:hypothetical protein [Metabacillus sp. Hm71]|uniref:hypothetical protein n=1 Tax=Metabacillus sp. Hm71 TaxID=3450743 RepID=UPI003F435E49
MIFNIQNITITNMNQSSSVNTGNNFINFPMTNQPTVSYTNQKGGAGSFNTGNGNAYNNPGNNNANTI